MNTGASWSPDGSKIAVTLSKDGNPEIYVISAGDGSVLTRITDNKAIDTSPAWSPDGASIAIVSDREGGPQIFVAPAGGGAAKRVSKNGSYNTTPAWSPSPPGVERLDFQSTQIIRPESSQSVIVEQSPQGSHYNHVYELSLDGGCLATSAIAGGDIGWVNAVTGERFDFPMPETDFTITALSWLTGPGAQVYSLF